MIAGSFSLFLKRTLGWVLSGALVFGSVAPPLAQARAQDSFWNSRRPALPKPENRSLPFDFSFQEESPSPLPIPPSLGFIKETYWPLQEAPGPWRVDENHSLPFVIHIQDAHEVASAQRSLSGLVGALAEENPDQKLLVCVEGAWGPLDPEFLSSLPDKELRDGVAEKLLNLGRLKGEEYFTVTHPEVPLQLVGVDDPYLHRKNSRARRETLKHQTQILQHLRGLRPSLRVVKDRAFPSLLRRLDAQQELYETEQISLKEWARALLLQAPSSPSKEMVQAFVRMSDLEPTLSTGTLMKEMKVLLENSRGSSLGAPRAPQESALGYRARMLETLLSKATPSDGFKETRRWVDYLNAVQKVDKRWLLEHLEILRKDTTTNILKGLTEEQRKTVLNTLEAAQWVRLTERLWTLEMTPTEWASYDRLRRNMNWTRVENILGLQGPTMEQRRAEIHPHRYYRTAIQRNEVLIQNTLTAAQKGRAERVVLIAGGFHTPGLTRLLRNNGASHVVITPVFHLPGAPKDTLRSLSQLQTAEGRTQLSQWVWKELKNHPETMPLLKEWQKRYRFRSPQSNFPVKAPPTWQRWANSLKSSLTSSFQRWYQNEKKSLKMAAVVIGLEILLLPILAMISPSPEWTASTLSTSLLLIGSLGIFNWGKKEPDPVESTPHPSTSAESNSLRTLLSNTNPDALNSFFREIQAVDDLKATTLFMEQPEDTQNQLVNLLDGRILGRIIYGMSEYYRKKIETDLRELVLLAKQINSPPPSTNVNRAMIEKLKNEFDALLKTYNDTYFTHFVLRSPQEVDDRFLPSLREFLKISELNETLEKILASQDPVKDFRIDGRDFEPSLLNELITFANPNYSNESENVAAWNALFTEALRDSMWGKIENILREKDAKRKQIKETVVACTSLYGDLSKYLVDYSKPAAEPNSINDLTEDGVNWGSPFEKTFDYLNSGHDFVLGIPLQSAIQKKHFLKSLARKMQTHPAFNKQKLLELDFVQTFSDPARQTIVYQIFSRTEKKSMLLDATSRIGDVVVVLDLDVFKHEDIEVITRVLDYYHSMKSRNQIRPKIILLASTELKNTQFDSQFKEIHWIEPLKPIIPLLRVESKLLTGKVSNGITVEEAENFFDLSKRSSMTDPAMVALRALEWTQAENPQGNPGNRQEIFATHLPNTSQMPLRDRVQALLPLMPLKAQEATRRLLAEYTSMKPDGLEADRLRDQLETISKIPFGRFSLMIDNQNKLPSPEERIQELNNIIRKVIQKLQHTHIGQERVIRSLLESVYYFFIPGENKLEYSMPVLVGPPGVGKTSLLQAIAGALEQEAQIIPLGGISDGGDLMGVSPIYLGAHYGLILKALLNSVHMLIYDEIDKTGKDVSSNYGSISIVAALLQILDPDNASFEDLYLPNIPFLLNRLISFGTANSKNMDSALVDRLTIIEMPGYSIHQKINIGIKAILAPLLADLYLKNIVQIENPYQVIHTLATDYTRDLGARDLKRAIESLVNGALLEWFQTNSTIVITPHNIRKYLPHPHKPLKRTKTRPGMVYTLTRGWMTPVKVLINPSKIELMVDHGWPEFQFNMLQTAYRFLQTHGQNLSIEWPEKGLGFNVSAPQGLASDDASNGLAFLMALISSHLKQSISPEVGYLSGIEINGDLEGVQQFEIQEKLNSALSFGTRIVFLSTEDDRKLFEIFKNDPNFIGPVLNMDDRTLTLSPQHLYDSLGLRVKTQWDQWNRAIDQVNETSPSPLFSGGRVLKGSYQELMGQLQKLPQLEGQMIYVLSKNASSVIDVSFKNRDALSQFLDQPVEPWKKDIESTLPSLPVSPPRREVQTDRTQLSSDKFTNRSIGNGITGDMSFNGLIRSLKSVSDTSANREVSAETRNQIQLITSYLNIHHPEEFGAILNEQFEPQVIENIIRNSPESFSDIFLSLEKYYMTQVREDYKRTSQTLNSFSEQYRKMDSTAVQKMQEFLTKLFKDSYLIPFNTKGERLVSTVLESLDNEGEKKNPVQIQRILSQLAALFLQNQNAVNADSEENVLSTQWEEATSRVINSSRLSPTIQTHLLSAEGALFLNNQMKKMRAKAVIDFYVRQNTLWNPSEAKMEFNGKILDSYASGFSAVEFLLRTPTFPYTNIIIPSNIMRENFPTALDQHFKRHGVPKTILKLNFNSLYETDLVEMTRKIINIIDLMATGEDAILIIDLEEFKNWVIAHRTRHLNRSLERFFNKKTNTRIVFLSSPQSVNKFIELSDPFRVQVAQHPLRELEENAFIHTLVEFYQQDGLQLDQESLEWLTQKYIQFGRNTEVVELILSESFKSAQNSQVDLAILQKAWKNLSNESEEMGVRLLPSGPAKQSALEILEKLRHISRNTEEQLQLKAVLNKILQLPQESSLLPISSRMSENDFRETGLNIISKAIKTLNLDHYGHQKTKKSILRYLARHLYDIRYNLSPKGKILCLVGPPGTGKTSISKKIAEALGLKYEKVVASISNRDYYEGISSHYRNAKPGVFGEKLIASGVKNPLICLDEIDKIHPEMLKIFLSYLDPEQNKSVLDSYFKFGIDYSQVVWIATANSIEDIPEPLRNRFEIIDISGYSPKELEIIGTKKIHDIIKMFDLPQGIHWKDLPSIVSEIAHFYSGNSGVRSLNGALGRFIQGVITEFLLGNQQPLSLDQSWVKNILGERPKTELPQTALSPKVGTIMGLSVSNDNQGNTLPIMGGIHHQSTTPKIPVITVGNADETMTDSVNSAYQWLQNNLSAFKLDPEIFNSAQFVISFGKGNIKKGGNSAGGAVAAVMASLVLNRPLRSDFALTGQIDPTGDISPIGGLREKILAALNEKIPHVILPVGNENELLNIFETSPELLGPVEKGGELYYAFRAPEPLSESMDMNKDPHWDKTQKLINSKVQEHNLKIDRESSKFLIVSGNIDSMNSFLSDSSIKQIVETRINYVIVDHIDQILDKVLVPPLKTKTNSFGAMGILFAAMFMTLTLGIPDASAASFLFEVSPSPTAEWLVGLMTATFAVILYNFQKLNNFFSFHMAKLATWKPLFLEYFLPKRLWIQLQSYLLIEQASQRYAHRNTPNDLIHTGFEYDGGFWTETFPGSKQRFISGLRFLMNGDENHKTLINQFIKNLNNNTFVSEDDIQLVYSALASNSFQLLNRDNQITEYRQAIFLVLNTLGQALNTFRSANESKTLEKMASPLSFSLFLDPGIENKQDVIVLDGSLLFKGNEDLLNKYLHPVTLSNERNAFTPVVIVSENLTTQELNKKLEDLGFSGTPTTVYGKDKLENSNSLIDKTNIFLISTEKIKQLFNEEYFQNQSGIDVRLKILVPNYRAHIYQGDMANLFIFEEEIILEGTSAELFKQQLYEIYSESEANRIISTLTIETQPGLLKIPARSPQIIDLNQSIQKDILIRTQA